MKFKCSVCNSEIHEISISKKYTLREDFALSNTGFFLRDDKEYFDAEVTAIIYKCKCGEQVIKIPEIIDFVRDSDILIPKDIKLQNYGTLMVIKWNFVSQKKMKRNIDHG